MTTVSDALLATMKAHGIRHVFGVPAAQLGHVMVGASIDPDFTYLTTRHEEAAGHMAHAIAKCTGEMAACFGTVGPGAMNLVPGVAAAWADNIPMLVLTPNNQSYNVDPSKGLLQSVDQCGVFQPITKWSVPVREPVSAPAVFDQAIRVAKSGRPGPVHLDIPCDIGGADCAFDEGEISQTRPPRPAPSAEDIARVAKTIRAAKRPVVIAGGGVARSDAVTAFRRFIDATGIPATTSLNGRGSVSADYAGHIGSGGILGGFAVTKALAEADVVLAIGCKISSWMPLNKPPLYPSPPGQRLIQVDVSERVTGRNMAAAICVLADAREFLDALTEAVAGEVMAMHPGWVESLATAYSAYRGQVNAIADEVVTPGTSITNEAAMARAVVGLLPDDAIVAIDGGQTCEWAHTFYHPLSPRHVLFNPGMGHLGMGLPAANAAKLAHPDRVVACVTGDGAFGCTVQELETAARYGLSVLVVVFNDAHWGMYRPLAESIPTNTPGVLGTALTDVDFSTVAKGFGCHGETVGSLDDLPAAVDRALASGRPAVVDVKVDFTPHPIDEFWGGSVLAGVELG